ncbi:MAG: SpoIIE family protein phosphatase [Kiritimatiellae bacterium]|jgi:sigma-B regulation protein RsbU (phosphoserine phosphatase)|nr:SpoIIE family protein phosphatase [Kiritimatiellia bacterium]MDD4342251.1 SpoIIE family protein phosphatase [Kiritimatiellia bacterium]MDY0149964.1 SpoIIE family protein phosphatase [Kiritimatiellia bacterium]
MPNEEQHKHEATMRIDITPDMLEQLQQAPVPGGVRIPSRGGTLHAGPRPGGPGVIRIPATPTRPLGGEDFQVLLQSIYDAVFITDPQGLIVGANVRAEQFFAAKRVELCKKNVFDWLVGADRSLLDTILGSLEGNRFVLIQALCRRTDETMFPAEISVSRLSLGSKTHLSFFIRDITLRKESEERLKTGYNALQNSASGIAVADTTGTLAGYVNPAMLELLGLASAEDAYDCNFRDFLIEEALATDMIAAAEAQDTWTGEVEMKRKDGTPFFAQASLAPNLNPDGAMTGIVISLVDVTPQRQAQQQLELYATQLRHKNAEMEADLRMARDLQYAFLPSSYPEVTTGDPDRPGGLEFAHVYHPSGMVGGDFFDLLKVSDSQVLVFVADVMGHGARAALVVATLRGLLEQIAKETPEPGEFMTRLNAAYSKIFSSANELMFATACCVCLDVKTGRLCHANAGHPLPMVIEADGTVRMAKVTKKALGPALGLFGDAVYEHMETQLVPGERLVFYTDGLTEARNEDQREFEEDGLIQSLETHKTEALAPLLESVVNDVVVFTGTPTFEDDVCVLGIHFAET